jgi:hypothetical protein
MAINWGKADATSSYAWYTKEECELGGEYDQTTTFCEKQRNQEIPHQKGTTKLSAALAENIL